MRKQTLAWIICIAAASQPINAQQVSGVVRDSASAFPVPGAVVVALDAAGQVLGRTITDAAGYWRIVPRAPAMGVQVLRIGFRPRTIPLTARAGDHPLDVALTAIPTMLEHVRVLAERSQCPARGNAAQTLALVDQARAGLLATVVARETNPAEVVRLAYERALDANGIRAVSQTVRMETADRASVSFNAVQTAMDFTQRGFASRDGLDRTFYGPDADVLLDDGFARGYCFRIATPDPARPELVGLAFSPASRRQGRVDIDGTLWVDSVARALSHIEFRYLGLDELSRGFGSGGSVSFREVAPGVVLIDRWSLRLVGAARAGPTGAGARPVRLYQVSEVGGELASAHWPDGRTWTASLGMMRLTALRGDGAPAVGVRVGLLGTPYEAIVDSAGHALFSQLVPGPYAVQVPDPRLAAIALAVPVDADFVAVRDSLVIRQATIPGAVEYARTLCRAPDRSPDAAAVLGRVTDADGRPVANARWRLSRSASNGWTPVAEGTTGASGLLAHCRGTTVGQTVRVQAWREREAPTTAVHTIADALTTIPIALPSNATVRAETPAGAGVARAVDLAGMVVDSTRGAGVADAFVTLAGTRFAGVGDSTGTFRIPGVPHGRYVAELRTPALETIGVVGRTTIDVTGDATVRLYLPAADELVAAMCGPDAPARTGAVIGNVRLPGGQSEHRVTVTAIWTDTAAESGAGTGGGLARWTQARPDAQGTYRICGLPAGAPVVIRVAPAGEIAAAAHPDTVFVQETTRVARADITLTPGLETGAAFTGRVLIGGANDPAAAGDGAPVPGAEVAIPDLRMSTTTNRFGEFRLDDVPPGNHRVVVRGPGFSPVTAQVAFVANQTVDHRVVLRRPDAAGDASPGLRDR